jgi:hypothetical protein
MQPTAFFKELQTRCCPFGKVRRYIGIRFYKNNEVFRTKIFVESFNLSREIPWCYHFQTRNILPVIFKTISKHRMTIEITDECFHLHRFFPAARKLGVL